MCVRVSLCCVGLCGGVTLVCVLLCRAVCMCCGFTPLVRAILAWLCCCGAVLCCIAGLR